MERTCKKCGVEQPIENFNKSRGRPGWRCKKCQNLAFAAWRKDTPKGQAWNKERMGRWYAKLKWDVFTHYGTECRCCGETKEYFLVIDHIDGGGRRHREELGKEGKVGHFYKWLRAQGFPTGFQTLCHNCNHAKSVFGACPCQASKSGDPGEGQSERQSGRSVGS